MRKILFTALAIASLSSCKYDDSAIWEKVNSLDERVTNIEKQLKSMNESLTSLKGLYDALDNRLYITNVNPNSNGYSITFSDNSTISIKNGKDGINGKDAPIINVREDNGSYYWTQTVNGKTDYLLDSNGNRILANGITPLLRVSKNGYWEVSYDKGNTYQIILDANGNSVKATGSYDSIFKQVEVADGNLDITLSDGSKVSIPIGADIVNHRAIDLGLSVKWASCNMGAESEYARGGSYIWGDETGSRNVGTTIINLNSGNISGTYHDIATTLWGGKWRLPTKAEWLELKNIEWTEETVNGITGVRITGKNKNSIFLPCTGVYPEGKYINYMGFYWTSESYYSVPDATIKAYIMKFTTESNGFAIENNYYNGYLLAVRPIQDK